MIILGVYPGHNAAVCVLRDGEVLVCQELERWTRIKHDYGYREDHVLHVLVKAGVRLEEVDLVATNSWTGAPGGRPGTVGSLPGIPRTANVRHVECETVVAGRQIPALAVNHHLAHVACAFYTSPFDEATILTLDGGGDNESGAYAHCSGNRILSYEPQQFENVAGWWSGVTLNNYRMPRLHEWDPGSGAGKIMALAAYGARDEAVARRLREDMREGWFSPTYTDTASMAFSGDEDLSDTRAARSQALARALQDYTEDYVASLFAEAHRRYPGENLCYAGGVALNCVANARAISASLFLDIHVPPCPNDSGLALGMALYAHYEYGGASRVAGHFSPYTGPAYGQEEVERAAAALASDGAVVAEATPEAVAEVIARDHVVAVFRGRSECGPRALGHRSLLGRADVGGLRDRMNRGVKRREWYRPYAPVVLAERAAELLDGAWSPYMSMAAGIRPEWRARLAAVDHVDGSTRPQVIERAHEPFIYDVVRAVACLTGVPAVLNTSFNRQAPIVETPGEAAALFREFPVDHLVLDQYLVSKRAG